jgi:hypothetical protein
MAALLAEEPDLPVSVVDQLYSNDGQIELPESDNCFPVGRLSSARAWLVGFASTVGRFPPRSG